MHGSSSLVLKLRVVMVAGPLMQNSVVMGKRYGEDQLMHVRRIVLEEDGQTPKANSGKQVITS